MPKAPEHEIVYGIRPVQESLSSARPCFRLHVKDLTGERAPLAAEARGRGIKVVVTSAAELGKLAQGGNHQGVVGLFRPYEYADFHTVLGSLGDKDDALILALDSVKDPGNLGAILRTAAAAGVDLVVFPQDRAAGVTAAVMRASAGGADHVAVARVVNLTRALEELKKAGFWVFGTAADAKTTLWNVDLRGKACWVLGDEAQGIRRLVRDRCDEVCRIPMPGGFESLNVAAATAICLFESVRQRQPAL